MYESYFVDSVKGYYRHLAIVESSEYIDKVFSLIEDYLKVNHNPKVIYAFHPWLNGSKDRMKLFKERLKGDFIDIDYSNSEKFLGQSADLVILDTVGDFRPNYIARFVDMTRGGGLAIIYTDNFLQNKMYRQSLTRNGIVKDLFERRFLDEAKKHRGIILIQDDHVYFSPYSSNEAHKPSRRIPKEPKIPLPIHELCMSSDQNKILEESLFILGEGKRVLAITAARGRGKSASVGLFLAFLAYRHEENFSNIIITSPTYYSAQEIFNFMIVGLKKLKAKFRIKTSKDGKIMKIIVGDTRIKWVSPDLAKNEEGNLIVVDEAAAIGLETLDYIIRGWDKVILVTTIHGYEGSGKAFMRYLNKLKNSLLLKHVKMEYPIRYAKGDPIERFMFNVLLLDAEAPDVIYKSDLEVREIPQEDLFSNDNLLRAVYGILVEAHYRNSPDDLMLLGDMAFQKIIVGYSSGLPIAVAQVVFEGGLNDTQITDIARGLKNEGHLIPHRIIKYVRALDFGKMIGWRIMRIAVSPENQGKGIGSKILNEVIKNAQKENVDWIGSSFVVDYSVLRFWVKNGFVPIYLSSIKNEQLNGYSIIVVKPLTERASKFVKELSGFLKDKLLRTSHQVYYNLNPLLIALILRSTYKNDLIKLEDRIPYLYLEKIKSYISGEIPYNSIADAAHYITTKYFLEPRINLSEDIEGALVARVLQGKSWYHAGLMLGLSSKEVELKVKTGLRELLQSYDN
ncbi:tRNA(Met) cytidine acetyltransferase TmcA [Sulfolobus tengchongensis]|uniref:tRNA(Met) cytidine acetyltransferase TmcA n=1 Tax=Sulfolobus tengchongensis TaxID=207809 RepID=A0AAX4L1C2_9CREN